jgi:Skp family chaperone for outer membrane proteins
MLGTVVAAVAVAVVLVGIVLAWVVTAVAELREAKATTADLDLVIDHINQISRDVYSEQDRIAVDVDRARDEAQDAKSAQATLDTSVKAVEDKVTGLEGDVGNIKANYASEDSLRTLQGSVSGLLKDVQDVSSVVDPPGGGIKIAGPSESDYLLLKSDANGQAQICTYTAASQAESCKTITTT